MVHIPGIPIGLYGADGSVHNHQIPAVSVFGTFGGRSHVPDFVRQNAFGSLRDLRAYHACFIIWTADVTQVPVDVNGAAGYDNHIVIRRTNEASYERAKVNLYGKTRRSG